MIHPKKLKNSSCISRINYMHSFPLICLLLIICSSYGDTISTLSGHISSANTQSFVSISPFHDQPTRKQLYHSKTSHLTFDADSDTVPDIYEIDNDNDGLTDNAELFTHQTDLNDKDTDDDDLLDGWEVIHFLDPLVNDANIDTDGDGFSNFQEFTNSTNPNVYALSLKEGWNLISLARIPEDNSVGHIFGNNVKGNVWYWDDNQFKIATHIDPLKGYWIYAPTLTEIEIDIKNQSINIAITYNDGTPATALSLTSAEFADQNWQNIFLKNNVETISISSSGSLLVNDNSAVINLVADGDPVGRADD